MITETNFTDVSTTISVVLGDDFGGTTSKKNANVVNQIMNKFLREVSAFYEI